MLTRTLFCSCLALFACFAPSTYFDNYREGRGDNRLWCPLGGLGRQYGLHQGAPAVIHGLTNGSSPTMWLLGRRLLLLYNVARVRETTLFWLPDAARVDDRLTVRLVRSTYSQDSVFVLPPPTSPQRPSRCLAFDVAAPRPLPRYYTRAISVRLFVRYVGRSTCFSEVRGRGECPMMHGVFSVTCRSPCAL